MPTISPGSRSRETSFTKGAPPGRGNVRWRTPSTAAALNRRGRRLGGSALPSIWAMIQGTLASAIGAFACNRASRSTVT